MIKHKENLNFYKFLDEKKTESWNIILNKFQQIKRASKLRTDLISILIKNSKLEWAWSIKHHNWVINSHYKISSNLTYLFQIKVIIFINK